MNDLILYFEVDNIATDEDGTPVTAGMQLTIGQANAPAGYNYDEFSKNVDLDAIADMLHVPHGSARVISKEEYEAEYPEEDDS